MNCLLIINAGSSSIKFGLFEDPGTLPLVSGTIRNIGQPGAEVRLAPKGSQPTTEPFNQSFVGSGAFIVTRVRQLYPDITITGIAHRLVHGGPQHLNPEIITPILVANLRRIESLDPNHLPAQIELIEELLALMPSATHVACFDTAFHAQLPSKAKILPIPRRYTEQGVRKFGFHGLALQSVIDQLRTQYALLPQKIVVAHMGSGVSITAIKDCVSVDTSMALSPNSGVPMSTRSGNIDPGLVTYIAKTDNLGVEQITDLLANKSGLLGISDQTPDMEQLLAGRDGNPTFGEAIDVFCYEVSKQIAAMSVALGGLDLVVFSGGMGEVASAIRAQVCEPLAHLGIQLDQTANQQNVSVVSATEASVQVRIVQVDETAIMLSQMKAFITQSQETSHANNS